MPGLNLERDPLRKIRLLNSRTSKLVFGAAVLLALPLIGTTLAASISINTTNTIQFGQGVVQATACDQDVTVAATTSFANASGAGSFNVDTITLSGISADCASKTFLVRAYDTTTATPSTIASSSPTTALTFIAGSVSAFCTIGSQNFTTYSCLGAGPYSIAIKVPVTLSAASVYKFTLETS